MGTNSDGDSFEKPDTDSDTTAIETYEFDPYFKLTLGSPNYVQFRSPMLGSTTSAGTTETRSEMREMHYPTATLKASWDATTATVHNLKARVKVNHVATGTNGTSKARIVLCQMHCTTVFGVLVYYDGPSDTIKYKFNKTSDEVGTVSASYNIGDWVNIGLSVSNTQLNIYVNDVLTNTIALNAVGSQTVNTTCYFKFGSYNQEQPSDGYNNAEYNEVFVAAAKMEHGVAWASGGYDPIGSGISTNTGAFFQLF